MPQKKASAWPQAILRDPDVLDLDKDGKYVLCKVCHIHYAAHGGKKPKPVLMNATFRTRAWDVHKNRTNAHLYRSEAVSSTASTSEIRVSVPLPSASLPSNVSPHEAALDAVVSVATTDQTRVVTTSSVSRPITKKPSPLPPLEVRHSGKQSTMVTALPPSRSLYTEPAGREHEHESLPRSLYTDHSGRQHKPESLPARTSSNSSESPSYDEDAWVGRIDARHSGMKRSVENMAGRASFVRPPNEYRWDHTYRPYSPSEQESAEGEMSADKSVKKRRTDVPLRARLSDMERYTSAEGAYDATSIESGSSLEALSRNVNENDVSTKAMWKHLTRAMERNSETGFATLEAINNLCLSIQNMRAQQNEVHAKMLEALDRHSAVQDEQWHMLHALMRRTDHFHGHYTERLEGDA